MDFLKTIEPHLRSEDPLILETVLHALADYPNVPEEWTYELLKLAFQNEEHLASILIYIENQRLNEDAVKLLINEIPLMNQSLHLAVNLVERIEPKLALKYKDQLKSYLTEELWSLYEFIVHGTEEEVYGEYGETVAILDTAETFDHSRYLKAKKLAACIVEKGWVTDQEINLEMQDELAEDLFSFNGILTVYMIGLMKLERYIPTLASLLDRDDDILLEEVSAALISFQNDEVVKVVTPYLLNENSVIYASSVMENIKTEAAVDALRRAYYETEDSEDQALLIEALCHQLSPTVTAEISDHMDKEETSSLVDLEQKAYSYYTILGLHHPRLEEWRQIAMTIEENPNLLSSQPELVTGEPYRNSNKIGRNDPCPCGSGKKYKKCCGK
ncbi:SEC-C metal-binding domain-containing protein [Mesobacillus maritimus]|uniref:YecA family protein n=1 Tax=Mesobacillus maritimus TaxID=1643336 RepID=UPI00203E9016|nr:SEC-C metal-binding domain-containing protein [Mesobacillus maritimus]MCM3586594.1 SEC-C metal-binding domain-containing protein [Mesobacillus maritimus]